MHKINDWFITSMHEIKTVRLKGVKQVMERCIGDVAFGAPSLAKMNASG